MEAGTASSEPVVHHWAGNINCLPPVGKAPCNLSEYKTMIFSNLRLPKLLAALACTAVVPPAAADLIVGLTADNRLLSFSSASPTALTNDVAISGLQSGETVLAIDLRPSNGLLYGLGSSNRVYVFDAATGAVTSSVVMSGAALSGFAFGIDFNPVADSTGLPSLRVVSDADQNLRIDVVTGAVTVDSMLVAGSPPGSVNPTIGGSAYSNNFFGATSTTLYNIDYNFDRLVIQSPPNEGRLMRVGELLPMGPPPGGADLTNDLLGFDISGTSGIAYASLTSPTGTGSYLYTVNLATGAATVVGSIGENQTLRGLSVLNFVPEPGSAALAGLGLLTMLAHGRWRRSATPACA